MLIQQHHERIIIAFKQLVNIRWRIEHKLRLYQVGDECILFERTPATALGRDKWTMVRPAGQNFETRQNERMISHQRWINCNDGFRLNDLSDENVQFQLMIRFPSCELTCIITRFDII
jgi:hypothetical protein